ncbi:MAG: hypothetical protein JWR48_2203, partial [Mycobacterium sp.]|nr:hypothetical protein [Mycobacterium sp.]
MTNRTRLTATTIVAPSVPVDRLA